MAAYEDGCGDGLFGPGVNKICRAGFDFTLLFEDSILNMLPAGCFILLAPLRIRQLATSRDKIKRSPIYLLKLITASILIVTGTVTLAFVAAAKDRPSPVAVPAAVLDLIALIELLFLVHFEHFKSVRPSLLSCSFLSVTILLDIARVRSAWMQFPNTGWIACLTAFLVAKVVVLAIESVEKRRWLLEKALSTESISGPFNRALFLWLNSLLKTGWQAVLRPDLLPPVDDKLCLDSVYPRLHRSWHSVDHKRKYALLIAMVTAFKREILAAVAPRLCLVGLNIAQPFMIGQAVTFLETKSANSNNTGYGLLGAFALVFISTAISTAIYQHLGYRVMTMLRGGLIAILYNQMMSLPVENVNESGAMSLMGSDTETFAEYFHATITDTWADVLQLALAIYLLARMIGAICIAPIVFAVLFTWLSFRVGSMIAGRQRKWLEATQSRVNFTTDILGRIRDIKILGLSEVLFRDITDLRDKELEISKTFRRVQTAKVCLVNMPEFLGQFAVFAAYGIAAHVRGTGGLSVSETATTLSLVNLLLVPLRNLLSAIPDTFSSISCLQRIQEFLVRDPLLEKRLLGPPSSDKVLAVQDVALPQRRTSTPDIELIQRNTATFNNTDISIPAIAMNGAVFGWNTPSVVDIGDPPGNKQISFQTPSRDGSLTIIVGPIGCGKSTILKAMLGETAFIRGEVALNTTEVAYCAQDPWIISGSIRANIIGISNDLFDAEWYSTVIQACALDIDISHLQFGDNTLVGSKGVKLSGGQKQRMALARAVYSRKRIILLDDILSGLDNTTRSNVFHRLCSPTGLLRRSGYTVLMAMSHVRRQHLSMADYILVLGKNGEIVEQGRFNELSDTQGAIADLDLSDENASPDGGASVDREADDRSFSHTVLGTESESLQTPGRDVWKFYFDAMGWTQLALLCIFLSIESGFGAFRYIWLTWWSASDGTAAASHLGYWIGIYTLLGVLGICGLALGVFWNWVIMVPRTSRKLHRLILAATMGAPATFLSNTETGFLINRFSQDMRLLDMILPSGFIGTGFQLFGTIAQAAIAVAALPYLAIVIPFVVAVLALIQRFYLRTSCQLRLLDIEMKAPMFSHFIESLHGIVTIRAFGWNTQYMEKTILLLDVAQRPYYLLLSVQRWLVLVLNLVVAGIVILLVGLGVGFRDHVSPGLFGVALVMMTSLGQMIADLIQAWTRLETSLGAISRIKSFSENTPREADGSETRFLVEEWPTSGAIEFRAVSAKHDETSGMVLKDINLAILPGQKIGVCGRTGSGKSSLVMSLLRMVQMESGHIMIDGQDIANVSPSLIRKRLNCMTQEPLIFSGTVRRNMDPLSTGASDDGIIGSLMAVGIWNVIHDRAKADGFEADCLEAKMHENFLSHGQRQLFAVARALLRKSRILLLDEPTSRLDAETHAHIQAVIRSHFAGSTIIMIAHRLDSLVDFDRVAVLDDGKVVEYDSPTTLLADSKSAFARLYRGEGQDL